MGNRVKPTDRRHELREVRERAEALDLRRRKQIGNQSASISRLLEEGSYDNEMKALHDQLAEAQSRLVELSR